MPILRGDKMTVSRQEAARRCVAVFDTGFFRALCEPARIAVLRVLILLGRADIAAVAARLPQDRSVVARHLQQLAAVQIIRASKEGRHVFYQIDAGSVADIRDQALIHREPERCRLRKTRSGQDASAADVVLSRKRGARCGAPIL